MNRFHHLAAVLLLFATAGLTQAATTDSNRELVVSFYRLLFVEHQVREAVETYLDEAYIQHNPYVPDGRQPLLDYFEPYFDQHPDATVDIKRVLADGDLVMVHSHWKRQAEDPGQAVMDIFRVEDGRIVEHWDVVQDVPETRANDNTMF